MIKSKKMWWALCIGTGLLAAVLLVSHTYNDIVITTRHGINFWNILLDGKLLDFYKVNVLPSGNLYYGAEQGCAYNILVYIVFAIWNLPLYLLERFAGVDVMNAIPCLVYSKLLVVVCLGVTVVLLKKLLEELKVPDQYHNLALYLYASGSVLISVIFISGQYDVFSLIFQLLGLLAFIKGKNLAFSLWFGVAFCFKYFAAVIYLPLMLLRHKKVITWIKNLVLLLIPVVLTKIPFIIRGFFVQSVSTTGSGGDAMAGNYLLSMLTSSNVNDGLNLFVVAYAAVLVWCYLQEDEAGKRGFNSIWACMLAYGAFFGLMNAFPYWSVLLAPFVVLAMVLAPKHLYLNLILEAIAYAGLTGVNIIRYPWVYFGDTMKPMIWSLSGLDLDFTDSLLYDLVLVAHTHPQLHAFANSFFVAAFAALAWLTCPNSRSAARKLPDNGDFRDVLVVRFLLSAVVCLLPILALFV